MISACIFSKNRPMQLDACLRSAYKNAPYITDLKVLYTYDDPMFAAGYDSLKESYPWVTFLEETCKTREDWRDLIILLVSKFMNPYFMWGTDDSLFYRKVDINQEKLDWVFKHEGAKSLNLRIGLNVVWQNHWFAEKCPPIPIKSIFEDIISWDSSNISVQNDVGRLWQNDASIMPADEYLSFLFKENHWYQGRGCRGLDNLAGSGGAFNPRIGAAFKESVYVNIPVNLVHVLDNGVLYADNWGKFVQQDIITLQKLFDAGYRIDWESIDFSNLDCGRKEVLYDYISRAN